MKRISMKRGTGSPSPAAGRHGLPVRYALPVLVVLLSLGPLWSCKDSITGEGPFDIVFPDSNISYNNLIQPLFNRGCALTGGCHAGDEPASGLSLETYQLTTDRVGIVVPGLPDESILQLRIDGRLTPRMPLNRPQLTDNQIRGIRQWILEGAINN